MDDNNYKVELENIVLDIQEKMGELDPSTEAYSKLASILEKLYKLLIDEEKIESEASERASQRGNDSEQREHEMMLKMEETRQTWIKTVGDTTKIIFGLIANGIWIRSIMRFEKTGIIASKAFAFVGKYKIF